MDLDTYLFYDYYYREAELQHPSDTGKSARAKRDRNIRRNGTIETTEKKPVQVGPGRSNNTMKQSWLDKILISNGRKVGGVCVLRHCSNADISTKNKKKEKPSMREEERSRRDVRKEKWNENRERKRKTNEAKLTLFIFGLLWSVATCIWFFCISASDEGTGERTQCITNDDLSMFRWEMDSISISFCATTRWRFYTFIYCGMVR